MARWLKGFLSGLDRDAKDRRRNEKMMVARWERNKEQTKPIEWVATRVKSSSDAHASSCATSIEFDFEHVLIALIVTTL